MMIEQDFMGWLTEAMSASSPIDELRGLARYQNSEEVCDQAVAALSLSISRHEHESDQGVALLFIMSAVVFLDIKRAAALVTKLSEELSDSLQAAQLPRLEAFFARATFKALQEGAPFEPETLFEEHQYLSEQYLRLQQGGHTNALSLLCANMLDSFALFDPSLIEHALTTTNDHLGHQNSTTSSIHFSELEGDDTSILSEEDPTFVSNQTTTSDHVNPIETSVSRIRLNPVADSMVSTQSTTDEMKQSKFTQRLQMNTAELDFVKKESLALEAIRLAEEAQAHALAAQREAQRMLQEAEEAKRRAEEREHAAQMSSAPLIQSQQAFAPIPLAQPSHVQSSYAPTMGSTQSTRASASDFPYSQNVPFNAAQNVPLNAAQNVPFNTAQNVPFNAAQNSVFNAAPQNIWGGQSSDQLPFSISHQHIPQPLDDGLGSELPSMMLRRLKPPPRHLIKLISTQALIGLLSLIFSFLLGIHFVWIGPMLILGALFMYQAKRIGWILSLGINVFHGLYLLGRLQQGDFHSYLRSPLLYLVALAMFALAAGLLENSVRTYFKSTKRF